MTTLLIVVHVTACIVLIVLVLIQRGRGAGLVESFAGVESMFGTKTSDFLTRITTIMSVIFFITCLSLAVLSVKQSKSLMVNLRTQAPKTPTPQTATASTSTSTSTATPQTATATASTSTATPQTAVKPETVNVQAPVSAAAVSSVVNAVKPDAAKAQ